MQIFSDADRLTLLNLGQKSNPWESTAAKRQCVVCETTFAGSEVNIHPAARGQHRLGCPRCQSHPRLWVRVGNPLLDAEIWEDWESAIDFAQSKADSVRALPLWAAILAGSNIPSRHGPQVSSDLICGSGW